MAKKIKEASPTKRLAQLKKQKKGLFGIEIGCISAPFIIMTIVKFDEFFVKNEAWRISISFFLMLGASIIVVIKFAQDKLKLNLGTLLSSLVIADAILWVIGKLITELTWILLYIIIGVGAALVAESKRKKEAEEEKLLEEGIKAAKVDIVKKEYIKEETNAGNIL